MTTARPFRAPRDVAGAAIELQRESGRQFDAEVVDAFLRVLHREGELREAA
jgi:HD-GYP domain-containing protein (c-di-GMP phosphodiesterase class II)